MDRIPIEVTAQPDDTTCGPSCLHSVYRYYRDPIPLNQVIDEVPTVPEGGTVAVLLACHALRRGYSARIYTYNLHVFDPTWFQPGVDIADRLLRQSHAKLDPKLLAITPAYLEFLARGGELHFEALKPSFVEQLLATKRPVVAGLSATYLYNGPREYKNRDDDIRGEPSGHFVVLSGLDRAQSVVQVDDPLGDNPRFRTHTYAVSMDRLIASILLGVVTHDANLLVIEPTERAQARLHDRTDSH